MCAYTHARERVVIGIFTIQLSIIPILLQSGKMTNPSPEKTTRRFQQNKPSFSVKQHVVFSKTTRRFWKETRRFWKETRQLKRSDCLVLALFA